MWCVHFRPRCTHPPQNVRTYGSAVVIAKRLTIRIVADQKSGCGNFLLPLEGEGVAKRRMRERTFSSTPQDSGRSSSRLAVVVVGDSWTWSLASVLQTGGIACGLFVAVLIVRKTACPLACAAGLVRGGCPLRRFYVVCPWFEEPGLRSTRKRPIAHRVFSQIAAGDSNHFLAGRNFSAGP